MSFGCLTLQGRNAIIAFLNDARHLVLQLLFDTLVVIQFTASSYILTNY